MIPAHEHASACRPAATLIVAGVLALWGAAQAPLVAQAPMLPSATALRSIRVVPSGGGGSTTVVLEADGPLPEPASEPLDGPPRIYLDLEGVVPAPTITRTGRDSRILRVRVARHSDNPLVTRVVFDLSSQSPYRVDTAPRAEGRLVVVLGESGSASTRPSPPAVARPDTARPAGDIPPRPLAPVPRTNAAPPQPPSAARSSTASRKAETAAKVYDAEITVAVERLEALRPVLAAIDNRSEAPADLPAMATEFDAIGHLLAAIKPPAAREPTHALLVRACALGAVASRTLQESVRTGDSAGRWNAASAAAGALMLLDRATEGLNQ